MTSQLVHKLLKSYSTKGHKHVIAFLNLRESSDGHTSQPDREQGYSQTMVAQGLDPVFIHNKSNCAIHEMGQAVAALFKDNERMLAIITHTPAMAHFITLELAQMGLSVPQDVSLITFADDSPIHTGALVDTLRVPWEDLGVRAVEQLYCLIDGRGSTEWTIPPFIYESCKTVALSRSSLSPVSS